jgi:hypothetical protein
MTKRNRRGGIFILACFVFFTSPPLGTARDSQELRDPCAANIMGSLGELGGGSDHLYTEGTIFERVPPSVVNVAQRPHPPTTTTVFAIPLDEGEYKSVFKGKEISQSVSRELNGARLAFRPSLDDITYYEKLGVLGRLSPDRSRSRHDFEQFLATTDIQFILIAGHNDGGKFTYIGGEQISLPLLGEDCERARKTCVFIVCHSKDYLRDGSIGIGRELTLPEGAWITRKIERWLRSQDTDVSVEQLAAYVRNVSFQAHFRYHVSYFILGSCAIAGTPAVVYLLVEGAET